MGALWAVEHTQSQRGLNPENHSPNSAYEPSGLNHTCPGKTENKVAKAVLWILVWTAPTNLRLTPDICMRKTHTTKNNPSSNGRLLSSWIRGAPVPHTACSGCHSCLVPGGTHYALHPHRGNTLRPPSSQASCFRNTTLEWESKPTGPVPHRSTRTQQSSNFSVHRQSCVWRV